MRLLKLTLIHLSLFILLISSCRKDDDSKYNCSTVLKLEDSGKKVRLTWDEVNIPNFEAYIIERANKPFNTPFIGIDTIALIKDIHQNEFTDSFPLIAKSNNYRVSILANNNIICSSPNDISLDYFFIEFDARDFAFSEESDVIFMAESKPTSRILRYEYKTEIITHQIDSITGSELKQLCLAKNNNREELYISNKTNQILILNSESLGLINTLITSFKIIDVSAGNGLIYLMTDEPYSLLIYDRNTLDSLNHIYDDAFENYGEMAVLTSEDNRLGLFLRFQTMVIKFSDTGSFLEKTVNPIINNGGLSLTEIVLSKDGKYSVVSKSGAITDENFVYVLGLIPSLTEWVTLGANDFVFSPDSNFVYAFPPQKMVKFNLADGLPVYETAMPYHIFRTFRSKDDKLIIVAKTFDTGNNLYVDVRDF